ncbi:hypothetical protein ACHWQZ_G006481 [Mnemiopsis leidyi]
MKLFVLLALFGLIAFINCQETEETVGGETEGGETEGGETEGGDGSGASSVQLALLALAPVAARFF